MGHLANHWVIQVRVEMFKYLKESKFRIFAISRVQNADAKCTVIIFKMYCNSYSCWYPPMLTSLITYWLNIDWFFSTYVSLQGHMRGGIGLDFKMVHQIDDSTCLRYEQWIKFPQVLGWVILQYVKSSNFLCLILLVWHICWLNAER